MNGCFWNYNFRSFFPNCPFIFFQKKKNEKKAFKNSKVQVPHGSSRRRDGEKAIKKRRRKEKRPIT
jgi:hypothetical protein